MKPVDADRSSLSSQILTTCHDVYAGKNGLVSIGKYLKIDLAAPSKQITVLILGNHSAGKSTFINWYVGENIQKAGVAVETQGFTLVSHGRRRETLLSEAALMLAPCFQPLCGLKGISEFFTMELSSSTQRRFPLVTFVDTPGLVDGGICYPYDVSEALLLLGQLADLVFVFFDPIGQALCKRTVGIVKELARVRAQPMTFCLSKADEASSYADRQKVMVQIVQELCASADVNRQGFEIKSVYVPGLGRTAGGDTLNQIEDLCEEIEKTVSLTVQRSLNQLGRDCDVLLAKIAEEKERFKLRPTLSASIILAMTFLGASMLFSGGYDMTINAILVDNMLAGFSLIAIGFTSFAYLSNLRGATMLRSRYRMTKYMRVVHEAIQLKDNLYHQYLHH